MLKDKVEGEGRGRGGGVRGCEEAGRPGGGGGGGWGTKSGFLSDLSCSAVTVHCS